MDKNISAETIIELFDLASLDREGGMFRSTYHSELMYNDRELCNAIYYLLTDVTFSHLHRLSADEIYHFYYGDPIELLELSADGTARRVILGNDFLAGHVPQVVMRANTWHGSRVLPGGKFSFIGTSMSPGFDERDYEHCTDPERLIKQFPEHEDIIRSITDN